MKGILLSGGTLTTLALFGVSCDSANSAGRDPGAASHQDDSAVQVEKAVESEPDESEALTEYWLRMKLSEDKNLRQALWREAHTLSEAELRTILEALKTERGTGELSGEHYRALCGSLLMAAGDSHALEVVFAMMVEYVPSSGQLSLVQSLLATEREFDYTSTAILEGISPGKVRQSLVNGVAFRIATDRGFDATTAWVRQLDFKDDYEPAESGIRRAFSSWVSADHRDLSLALHWFDELAEAGLEMRVRVAHQIAKRVELEEPLEYVHWVESIPPDVPHRRGELIGTALGKLPPSEAVPLVESSETFRDNGKVLMFYLGSTAGMSSDPAGWAAKMAENPTIEWTGQFAAQFYSSWAYQRPVEALQDLHSGAFYASLPVEAKKETIELLSIAGGVAREELQRMSAELTETDQRAPELEPISNR